MILDILKNKIAAVAVTAAVADGGAVTYKTLVPPPEEDVYRVTYQFYADGEAETSPDLENALCDMRIGADRECKYKLFGYGGPTLYIRGDARNPRGFSVGKVVARYRPPISQWLTHVLIEDLEAGFRIDSKHTSGVYYLLTMNRLTPQEMAELDRPRAAAAGSGE